MNFSTYFIFAISAILWPAEVRKYENFRHLNLRLLRKYDAFSAEIPKDDTIARVIFLLKAG